LPKFVNEKILVTDAQGVATGIIVVVETSTGCLFGGSALGERGKPAEDVAQEAVAELIQDLKTGACVDQYLQDQLIIFMALANGKSKIKTGPLTLHTTTAIHFAELLSGCKFVVRKTSEEEQIVKGENSYMIECDGIGWFPPKNDQIEEVAKEKHINDIDVEKQE